MSLIPGSGSSPGGGHGSPCPCSCWGIPWTEEPGRLQSTRGTELHMTEAIQHTSMHTRTVRLQAERKLYRKLEKKWTNSLEAPGCYEPMSFLVFFFFFWCRVYTDSCKMSVSNTGKSFILSFNRGAIFKEGCWLFFLKIFSPKLSFQHSYFNSTTLKNAPYLNQEKEAFPALE